jgi:hypothetical protein
MFYSSNGFAVKESTHMIIKGKRLKRALLVALADSDLQKILDADVSVEVSYSNYK